MPIENPASPHTGRLSAAEVNTFVGFAVVEAERFEAVEAGEFEAVELVEGLLEVGNAMTILLNVAAEPPNVKVTP